MEEPISNPEDIIENALTVLEDLNEVGGWEIYDDTNEIISKRRTGDDGFYYFCIHTTIETNVEKALEIITNSDKRKSWDEYLLDSSVLYK